MLMKKILVLISLCLTTLTLGSCARVAFDDGGRNSGLGTPPDNGGSGAPPSSSPHCSLDGTWVRCTDNGLTSTQETLAVNGNVLSQTVDLFLLNDSCAGSPTNTSVIHALLTLGLDGASAAIPGATDLDITAGVDLGCGIGLTSYTALDFSPDCTQLQLSSAPGCDPASRGLTLDGNAYISQ